MNTIEPKNIFPAGEAEIKLPTPTTKRVGVATYEDKGIKLETESNNDEVSKAMLMAAHKKGWKEIKISGSDVFQKDIEKHAKNVEIKISENEREGELTDFRGRENSQTTSKDEYKKMAASFSQEPHTESTKKHTELSSAVALISIADKKAAQDGLSTAQREIVKNRVKDNLVRSIEKGELPNIKIKETIQEKKIPQEKELSR